MDYRIKKNNEKKSIVKKVESAKKNANVENKVDTTITITAATTINSNTTSELKTGTHKKAVEEKELNNIKLNNTKGAKGTKATKTKNGKKPNEEGKIKLLGKIKTDLVGNKAEKIKKDEKTKVEKKVPKEVKVKKEERGKKLKKTKTINNKKNEEEKSVANDVKPVDGGILKNVDMNKLDIDDCTYEEINQTSQTDQEDQNSINSGVSRKGEVVTDTVDRLAQSQNKDYQQEGEIQSEAEEKSKEEQNEELLLESTEEKEEVKEKVKEDEDDNEGETKGIDINMDIDMEIDKKADKDTDIAAEKQSENTSKKKSEENAVKDILETFSENRYGKRVETSRGKESKVENASEIEANNEKQHASIITDADTIGQEHKFERKVRKSDKMKRRRQNELLVAYWIRGIADILNEGFQNEHIKESRLVGRKMAEVLKKVVEISYWNNVYDLIETVKYLGKEIIKNNKLLFVIPNVIRRVLKIIRTEHFKQLYMHNNNYKELGAAGNISNSTILTINASGNPNVESKKRNNESTALYERKGNYMEHNNLLFEKKMKTFDRSVNMYFENASNESTYKIPATSTLKHSIIEGITELMAEIDVSWEEGEQRASYDLFMENDVILTMGHSVGVEKFLKSINKKKDGISVIVVGGDINRSGFRMAKLLSEDGVDTTYISDSAVFAVIPKVTKIVLGSVAVSSSGGAITKLGGFNIASSAQFNSKPVTIILPLFKLLYVPLFDPVRQNELQPGPSKIYKDPNNLFVKNPKYDYIPEHLIALYITEMGPVDSFQLYNIAQKKYHWEDLDLSFD